MDVVSFPRRFACGLTVAILSTTSAAAQFYSGTVNSPTSVSPSAQAPDYDSFTQRASATQFTELPRDFQVFVGYDSWRGITDDGWGNNGIHSGGNFGTRLGRFSDWTGVGLQIGGSVGVYNWNGTDYHLSHQDEVSMQGFLTAGFFRRANDDSRWVAALVQDWMLTSNYGIFAENPTLGQWRAQLGYAVTDWQEFGVWTAWRVQDDTRDVDFFGPTTYRGVNQLNGYWHYKWDAGGPDTWLWVGAPEHGRLNGDGSLGDYTVGVLAQCPLNDRVQLYAQVSYMHPSSSPGPPGSNDENWCFYTGLTIFPARTARSATVAGRRWAPLMPVANSGTFLTDVSQTY